MTRQNRQNKTNMVKTVKRIAGKAERVAGWIGINASTIETGTPGVIYVRLANGRAVKAFNNIAPHTYNFPVEIARGDSSAIWEVVALRQSYAVPAGEGATKDHHAQHEYPAKDTVFIKPEQFLYFLVLPSSAFVVYLYGGILEEAGAHVAVNNQTLDLSSYQPSSGALWAMLEIVSGVVTVTTSSTVASKELLTVGLIPIGTGKRICAVRLYSGQAQLYRIPDGINDFVDLRFVNGSAIGGSVSIDPYRVAVSDVAGIITQDDQFIFDAAQQLLLGLDSSPLPDSAYSQHQGGADGASVARFQYVYSDTLSHSPFDGGVRGGGTQASPTKVLDGMVLRKFRVRGYYDASPSAISETVGEIRFVADGDWSASSQPTRIEFYTCPAGSITLTLVGTITSDGKFDLASGGTFDIAGAPHGHDGVLQTINGWTAPLGTWSYSSVDDPTGVITSNADETGVIGVGDRIKFTNGGNIIYGIVTVISYSSPNTTIKFLHQIDPSDSLALYLLANSSITAPYYSHVKNPFGFPADENSWTFYINDTTQRTQVAPTATQWYNLGSVSINFPLGTWKDLGYSILAAGAFTGGQISVFVTLSTSNSSESDASMTRKVNGAATNLTQFESSLQAARYLKLASKTTYYMLTKSNQAITTLYNQNGQQTLVISAVCAYL